MSSTPQITFPELSVCRSCVEAEQFRVEMAIPCVVIRPAKVEVATLANTEPPERNRPADDERPAADMPPVNDEVAEEVFRIEPPVIVRPLEEANPPPPTVNPPEVQVEVAVDSFI